MDHKTLLRLEYNKIKEQLAGYAGSPLGKERVWELEPVDDLEAILRWQAETSEGREMLRLDPTAEINGWRDIRPQLQRAGRGALLEPEELTAITDTLAACRIVKNFLEEKRERYPILSELGFALVSLPDLEKKIKRAILPGGEIADHASSALAQVRRKLLNAQFQIKEHLEHVIRSPEYQKYLQDPIVTVREGRYVVPVKIEHRSQVPGIVHDQSASGATLFIEPMAVVDRNNEIRRLTVLEKQEVLKILTELSAEVASNAEALLISLDALGELDFIMAKAKYSEKLNAWAPAFAGEACMNIRQGRHPLLQGAAVPVNLRLGEDFDTLVVTGPNTGGKTVALKTAGIMVLMAQSGLHLPAEDGSKIGLFRQVFTDIGDEQSIEQSLSTFSSHMVNIVEIIGKAGRDSLVLLDELGAGTDPTEGAALAQSILEKLHTAGAKTIATTHYNELKNFAYTRERVENASVEFDAVTLRPTYRLLTGRPGRSNAFETALKLGLPEQLVERAREFLTVEQIKVEELMQNLEKAQQEVEASRVEAVESAEKARLLKEKYEKMEFDLAQKRESILAKAGDEARSLVKTARLEAESTIKELRVKLAREAAHVRENAIQEAREKLSALQKKVNKAVPEKVIAGKVPGILLSGEEVYLPKFNQHGVVLTPPGPEGEVQVQVGIIKINVPLNELRRVEKNRPGGQSETARVALNKAQEISFELDLRGLYAEDALFEVEKYLDDAFLAGLAKVRLIHGKGTGALRMAIHKHLNGHRRVKSFRLGEQGEGGFGVTVVDLA
ncbi:endonuclease MutS2 [Pelotomaculum terephthalicicum JT]|uniref:endonuclease MutS2 n=1 Tax=Pelotomaculum TaxID=191373 RepID=UPI0009C8B574|nr:MULTISPECIES: endonuclease MutS2 [Pelotomaculum]MCG9968144.1 endonuclease MutS2 [Pelotomaculum terephthalicicum JT]OPX83959.1 MAG: Endonuclease MutS2 [Pelotomaculum sp. PtaB.Bin117]OPY63164.1 MAG: Endonuclease MutS2 [Pelotomaculum sp. PtaU1.Bin065]